VLALYDNLPSQNGWKVRVLLRLLKISYHSRIVVIFAGQSRTEYRSHDPLSILVWQVASDVEFDPAWKRHGCVVR
jgi:hypothetical protein